MPPAAVPRETAPAAVPRRSLALGARTERIWLACGGVALVLLAALMLWPSGDRMFTVTGPQAAAAARQAIEARGVVLGPAWRVMPVVDNGAGGPQEFVSRTAGEAR